MSSRYIEVPAEAIEGCMGSIVERVAAKGGRALRSVPHGKEVVYDLGPTPAGPFVRVYTSLADGEAAVRACGEDAVRILVGCNSQSGFRPLGKSRRVFRTAPNSGDRVAAFLARLTDAVRDGFAEAKSVPACPACNGAMKRRENAKTGDGFWGCVEYPNCRGSRRFAPIAGNENGRPGATRRSA